jgi:hypothetical protein
MGVHHIQSCECSGLHPLGETGWKLASFRVAQQADDLLVVRHPDGSTEYQSGLGDIQFAQNVILGKSNGKVTIGKGWQAQFGEILYLRGGTGESPGQSYATSGYSICLAGVMRVLGTVSPALVKDSWAGFLADHFDLQYHSSGYEDPSSSIDGIRWAARNLVVKGFGP